MCPYFDAAVGSFFPASCTSHAFRAIPALWRCKNRRWCCCRMIVLINLKLSSSSKVAFVAARVEERAGNLDFLDDSWEVLTTKSVLVSLLLTSWDLT